MRTSSSLLLVQKDDFLTYYLGHVAFHTLFVLLGAGILTTAHGFAPHKSQSVAQQLTRRISHFP